MNASVNPSPERQALRQVWSLVLVFAALAIVSDTLINLLLTRSYHDDQRVSVNLELGRVRARLEEQVNTNLFLVHGMAAHISVRSGISAKEFDALARVLLSRSKALKNIAAAPDFVIRFVYPKVGNEAIIGLDYRRLPDQWSQALAARETGRMVVAGPLNLVQGGQGLVARVPVFSDEDGKFWGLVSSVINFDIFLERTGIHSDSNMLDIAIRGKDGRGDSGEVFWGNPRLFDDEAEAITLPVSLPSGAWQIAATPKGGWKNHSPFSWLVHLVVLMVAGVGCLSAILRNKSKRELIENETRLKAMSDAGLDALITIDSQDIITFWNPAAETMFGYTEAEMLGKKFHDILVPPQAMESARIGLEHFAKTGKGPVMGVTMEMEALHKSGRTFFVERSVASFQIAGQWYAVGSVRDITARKQSEKLLTELATTDALTGLANRRYFMEQAETVLRQAIRYRKHFSLMMLDLDHFKNINDTYGHDVGDKVLQAFATTIKQVLRETDIVGRIGGEEFTVAMPETDLNSAIMAAERMRVKLMETKVAANAQTIEFTVSIGLTHLRSPDTTLEELLKQADQSLYQAKRTGRNRVVAAT